MSKVFKEIMIMLLTCLVGILLFAVIFYEYIPNRKVVPEVTQYAASEQVKEAMADDIDQRNDQVVLTYKVTSSDLTNYKVTKDYVPGKANPFAVVSQDAEASATTKNGTNGKNSNSNSGTSSKSGGTSSGTTSNTGSLIDDGGTK